MTFTASDVLLKAASRIEEEGMWCQKEFYKLTNEQAGEISLSLARRGSTESIDWALAVNKSGLRIAECAQGALMTTAIELGEPALVDHALTRLNLYLRAAQLAFETIGFNDAPGRTAAEVAEAMRQAAS